MLQNVKIRHLLLQKFRFLAMTTPWYQSNSDIHHHNWGNHHHCKNTTGTPRPSPLALSIEHSLHTMSMPTNVNRFIINIVITFSICWSNILIFAKALVTNCRKFNLADIETVSNNGAKTKCTQTWAKDKVFFLTKISSS